MVGTPEVMIAVLLGSLLSLLFFSAALTAELQAGEPRRARELAFLVGILMMTALYSGHAVMDGALARARRRVGDGDAGRLRGAAIPAD